MKDAECENTPTTEVEDDDDDEPSRRESSRVNQTQDHLSDVPAAEFSMEPQNSSGDGDSLEGHTDRPSAGG